jgi:uncharacterized protein (TIGR02147 family)
MPIQPALSIYDYLDYRLYLEDFCRRKKELQRGFSYRVFCRKAGVSSAGYLSDVISGRRNLTQAYVGKFALALELDAKGRAYLDLLVSYKHANTPEARQSLYDALIQALPLRIQRLRRSQLDYFSKWHNVAIREALSTHAFTDDYAALAALFQPPLAAAQARSAVDLLKRLGLIGEDADGHWKSRHASLVSKGEESDSPLFRAFRNEMAAKGAEALEKIPWSRQKCFNITMSLSPGGVERLITCMRQFHRQVLETVQSDSGEDRVVQVNLHMFPLTRAGGADAV